MSRTNIHHCITKIDNIIKVANFALMESKDQQFLGKARCHAETKRLEFRGAEGKGILVNFMFRIDYLSEFKSSHIRD